MSKIEMKSFNVDPDPKKEPESTEDDLSKTQKLEKALAMFDENESQEEEPIDANPDVELEEEEVYSDAEEYDDYDDYYDGYEDNYVRFRRERTTGEKIWLGIRICFLIVLLLAAVGLAFLTVNQFKPAQKEELKLSGDGLQSPQIDTELTFLSWDIGYGTKGTKAAESEVMANLDGVLSTINEVGPNVLMLQDVDRNSSRSKHVDEYAYLQEATEGCQSSFAYNFQTQYVPGSGRVESGIATISTFTGESAERIAMPSSYKWPMSLFHEKRCISITRIPIEDSARELVLINVHLEDYQDGDSKETQLNRLARILEDEVTSGNFVIAGGNFNATFSNVDETKYPIAAEQWDPGTWYEEDFGYGFQLLMDDTNPTMRSAETIEDSDEYQYYMVDGYIISGNITVQSLETVDTGFQYSNHNPVVLKCILEA